MPKDPKSATAAKYLLQASEVSKHYGTRKVLDAVSFCLRPGERVALMGPSGAGKSTLLNCLGGIESFEAGEILFAGKALSKLSADEVAKLRRSSIGTVFQFFHLLPTLTAYENIALPLHLNGVSREKRHSRVTQLLEEVGVAHRADALPDALSGGEMQRVAIARALATEPALILADEPTGNLDSQTGDKLLDLIEALSHRHKTALIMVTHSEASTRICDRVLHMRDGRLANTESASHR